MLRLLVHVAAGGGSDAAARRSPHTGARGAAVGEAEMITMVLQLKRKQGLTREQFRDHYERSHVQLARKFGGPLFLDYRRFYVGSTTGVADDGSWESKDDGFDVITAIDFADEAAFAAWRAITARPEVRAELTADEARFLDRSKMRVSICESVRTWTAADVAAD